MRGLIIASTENAEHGPAQGQVLKGIYELDGLSLKICHADRVTKESEMAEWPRGAGQKITVTATLRRVLS